MPANKGLFGAYQYARIVGGLAAPKESLIFPLHPGIEQVGLVQYSLTSGRIPGPAFGRYFN